MRREIPALLLALALAAPVYAHCDEYGTGGDVLMESADRELPRPQPVVHDGIRYEVVRNARMRGFEQAGGVVAALDLESGNELWMAKVYTVTFDSDEERDVQEVFITQLRVVGDGTELEVTNERKQVYLLDLSDRSVREGKR